MYIISSILYKFYKDTEILNMKSEKLFVIKI